MAGDFNDYPDSGSLTELLTQTDLVDAMALPVYSGLPGTYEHGNAKEKFDYLLLSPALRDHDRVQRVDVCRKGFYARNTRHPTSGTPGAVGSLEIITIPWTEVFLDGKRLGTTPIRKKNIPAGKHVLRLKNPNAKIDVTQRLTVEAGKNKRIARKLR